MKKKYSIGEKVYLIHTNEAAIVSRIVNEELIYVEVDEMEIPVFTTDITDQLPAIEKPAEKQTEKPAAVIAPPVKRKEINEGIFLAFEPVKTKSGEITHFSISLVNDTLLTLVFNYYFYSGPEIYFKLEQKYVLAVQVIELHTIEYDFLNETPFVELTIRDVMNEQGTEWQQKIRPQNFFNKLQPLSLTGKESYAYALTLLPFIKKSREEKKKLHVDPELLKSMMMETDVPLKDAVEDSISEVDLHIERLTTEYENMNNSEMMQLQISRFQQVLERAIAGHQDKLYVIHGVGKGKLKQEIHRLLKTYEEVKSFNNDYHPRYGYGATEIILK